MSLISDVRNVLATVRGTDDTAGPRVPYTTPTDRRWFGGMFGTMGGSRKSQLHMTTAETTLFSVLDLISSDLAAVKWYGQRRVKNQSPDQEPPRVDKEQSHAVKLWQRPNRFMSGKYVRNMCTWHYRAVGEAWMVVDFYDQARTFPRAWWPVRPDRMTPVPDPDEYLLGYMYTGPDGTEVALELDEVMRITRPHPLDPHRGMGVVQTLGTTIGMSLNSAQWIANFFQNDATPGGIIEIPEGLPDPDYNRLRKRWNEQHRGVGKAHRVAILEWGKWVSRSPHMRDMQFAEIRGLSREEVMLGFRVHKHKMGMSDDVNLANAFAADSTFAKDETLGNCEEWYDLAEEQFLPLFGDTGTGIEICYENPVPEDKEQERAERQAKIRDALDLINNGVDPVEAWAFVGLPNMTMVEPDPEPEPEPVADPEPKQDEPDKPGSGELDETKKGDPAAVAVVASKLYLATKGNSLLLPAESRQILVDAGADIDVDAWEDDDPQPDPDTTVSVPPGQAAQPDPVQTADEDPAAAAPSPGGEAGDPVAALQSDHRVTSRPRAAADDVDLAELGEDWELILAALLVRWAGVLEDQYSALVAQVRAAVNAGDVEMLLALECPDAGATDVLTMAMVQAARSGADAVVREADAQGVTVSPEVPAKADLAAQATVITGLMAAGLAIAAGTAAMRVWTPDANGTDVAEQVREHLDSLTDAQPKQHLGGAVTTAQNAGRFETFAAAPDATYFASEQLDSNTCGPCRRVEGEMYATLEASKEDYPTSGYKKCEGLERCRGTVVAVWDTDEEGGD